MTQSQVDYWKLQESKRHNVESEQETRLHDTIDENLKAQDLATKRLSASEEWGFYPAPIEGMRTGGQLGGPDLMNTQLTPGVWEKQSKAASNILKGWKDMIAGFSLIGSLL